MKAPDRNTLELGAYMDGGKSIHRGALSLQHEPAGGNCGRATQRSALQAVRSC